MTRLGPRLALLLLALSAAGSASAVPSGPPEDFSAALASQIEAAVAESELAPVVIFENVRSHVTHAGRDLVVAVGRGIEGPLREGFFVYANRLEIRLERVSVDLSATTGPAPLALLAGAFRDAVGVLIEDRAPREYRPEDIADAVLDRFVGRVVLGPVDAHVKVGESRVAVRAASAAVVPDGVGVEFTDVRVTTGSGDALQAEEAVLGPRGELYVLTAYRHRGHRGESATFATSRDRRRLVNQGPIPIGALSSESASVGAAAFAALGTMSPALGGMFGGKLGAAR